MILLHINYFSIHSSSCIILYIFLTFQWSLGVIIWELVTLGSIPYPHLENIHDVCVYLAKGKRLIRPDNCSKHL